MFFGDSFTDLKVIYFLLIVSGLLGIITFILARKALASFFVFSLFGNLSVYFMVWLGSRVFKFHDLLWLRAFSLKVWPIINIIIFIVLLASFMINKSKNKNAQEK